MSPATATAILHDLRGPVKQGTARAANSVHALVYGKTGTSSRNVDALFFGLTQDFVGSFWLGYDRPAPMPGIHGGGLPARAFSKLTDFYYVRLAQLRFVDKQEADSLGAWGRIKGLMPREQTIRPLMMLGSVFASCFLLAVIFATGTQRQSLSPLREGQSYTPSRSS